MPSIKENAKCVNEAIGELKNFTKDDLHEYIKLVLDKQREYKTLGYAGGMERAIKEVNKEQLQDLFLDTTITANNIQKFQNVSDKIIRGKANLRSILIRRNENLGSNVASAKKEGIKRLDDMFNNGLSVEENDYLSKKENQMMIGDAIDGKKVSDAVAQKLGQRIADYITYRNENLILSNALKASEINGDRYLKQLHDSQKLLTGGASLLDKSKAWFKKDKLLFPDARKKWIGTIKKFLDLDKTFRYTEAMDNDGNLDMAKVDSILQDTFDNIINQKSDIFTRSVAVNSREAVAKRRRMFFVFKDARNMLEYNNVYGRGNLYDLIGSDIHAAGSQVGVAEMFGDAPDRVYNDLREQQMEADEKNNIKFRGARWYKNTDLYYNSVMGRDLKSLEPGLASMFGNIRAFSSMARLPKLALQSLSDIGYVAAFAQRIGVSYFEAYTNHLTNLFNLYKSEESVYMARQCKTLVDSHLGYLSRWSDSAGASDLVTKMTNTFFKYNLVDAFDRGNKISAMTTMAKHLYRNMDKSLDQMNPKTAQWIGKFLSPQEWEVLRKTKSDYSLFTTDNVKALTNEEINKHWESSDKSIPLNQVGNDLNRKVFSMFVVASENAVLSPTEFERAWLYQGTDPNSIPGMFLRSVMQFKGYSLAFVDRVLVQGYQDAGSVNQRLWWATSLLVGTLPLSILSNMLDAFASGQTYNPIAALSNGSTSEREQSLVNLLAPSLALYNGFLQKNNQNSGMGLQLLASPTTRFVGNSLATASALVTGDLKTAGKTFHSAANYMLPLQTTPFLSPYINEAMGSKSFLQPGQSQLWGK